MAADAGVEVDDKAELFFGVGRKSGQPNVSAVRRLAEFRRNSGDKFSLKIWIRFIFQSSI